MGHLILIQCFGRTYNIVIVTCNIGGRFCDLIWMYGMIPMILTVDDQALEGI